MSFLLYIIGVFILLDAVYHLIRFFVARCFVFNRRVAINSYLNDFTIVIPVLNEAKNIARLVKSFKEMNYIKKHFNVVFITTEREFLYPSPLNTIDCLKKELKQNITDFIQCIHCNDINGNRITQLNSALSILKKNTDFKKRYFVFIDADTVFNTELLININNSIIDPQIEYYQIAQNWFRGFDNISFLMKGFATLQTYKVFSEEVIKISEKICPARGKYFVGNGMIIKGSFFNKVPNFSDYVEDVRLGHICSFLNIKSQNIKNVILQTESAKSYKVMFQQTALWFLGCSLIFEDFKKAKQINSNLSLKRCFFKIFSLYFENSRWMLKNILNTILLITAIINSNISLCIITIIA